MKKDHPFPEQLALENTKNQRGPIMLIIFFILVEISFFNNCFRNE